MMSGRNGTIISTTDVKRDYLLGQTVVRALQGVSIDIARGDFVSIMGPSGSGKSTLMHLIGCLDSPTSGTISIEGEDVSEMSEGELARVRNRKIGFVFQQFNLLAKMTVLDNVMTPLMYAHIPVKERKAMAMEALDRVDLTDRIRHRPAELSGGQRQRVAIARALVTSPSIILADEPTGALDTATGEIILNLFEEINDGGKTVIVVTHDPEVGAVCRSHVYLRDGLLEEKHAS
jgi:putative ABC transport system ATP-binding protein